VLEFIDGRTLQQLVDDGGQEGLQEDVVRGIFVQIVRGPNFITDLVE
jgi:hypothetical protein